MLTASDLAEMRTLQESALPEVGTVQRYTQSSDGAGGYTQSWAAIGTINCRIGPLSGPSERALADASAVERGLIVTAPSGTTVEWKDRVIIGTRTFEVVSPVVRSYETALRLISTEIL